MRKKKHPKDMTSEELARYVLHPEVLRVLKANVKRLNAQTKLKRARF